MFLSHEKYKEIGAKMIWHWLDILHPRKAILINILTS